MDNDSVHIILTGGRIDSVWDGKQDVMIIGPHSHLPDYFNTLKIHDKFEFTEICMKDSRAITQDDRDAILKAIEESPSKKVIITHGTDTMPDSFKFVKVNLKRQDQVIVFTGSFTPLKDFDFSDAQFNLGFALAKVQDMEPGVYIAINGRCFTQEEMEKEIAEGKFYTILAKSN